MRRYHSPKDYLDAARDPATSAEELRSLAGSVYDFVRYAVAEHPRTEADVLAALIPQQIESWYEQQLADALVRHPNTPAQGLRVLAGRLPPVLNRGRNHDNGLRAGIALCDNPHTPLDAIQAMLEDRHVSTDFRRMVARKTTRVDVLQFLQNDRSDVVRKYADERLVAGVRSEKQ
ncbi:MAG: hypothetical protein JOZ51_27520 [Chloroflexi bacterium]|nr:hypothetical protein [Chloroflexota bacterium]